MNKIACELMCKSEGPYGDKCVFEVDGKLIYFLLFLKQFGGYHCLEQIFCYCLTLFEDYYYLEHFEWWNLMMLVETLSNDAIG